MLLMRAWFTITVLAAFGAWYAWSFLTIPPAIPAKKTAKVARARTTGALDAAQRVIDELEPRETIPAYVGFRGAVRRLQKRGAEQWERDVAEILERTDGDAL